MAMPFKRLRSREADLQSFMFIRLTQHGITQNSDHFPGNIRSKKGIMGRAITSTVHAKRPDADTNAKATWMAMTSHQQSRDMSLENCSAAKLLQTAHLQKQGYKMRARLEIVYTYIFSSAIFVLNSVPDLPSRLVDFC